MKLNLKLQNLKKLKFKDFINERVMLLGVIVGAIALIIGTVASIGANAQLTPSQVPPPAPNTPLPNDLRQPLIPGKAAAPNLTQPSPGTLPALPGNVPTAPGVASPPTNTPNAVGNPASVPTAYLPYPILHDLPNVRYTPRQEIAPANPTNYGYRFLTDVFGNPVYNQPIVVIHETVGSAGSALNTFQRAQLRESDQRSYHTLIRRDGTVIYLVPPEYRAFGAGNSVFDGPNGPEAVLTNPQFPPSVNNFAYHISLESPSDGRGNERSHSGYTAAQYQSLAWLVTRTGIPLERVTTHRAVDRSGTRFDPRSFDGQRFVRTLQTLTQVG